MAFNFQNKPIFGNTMNFLEKKIELKNRRDEAERKKEFMDKMRNEEYSRSIARDEKIRGFKLDDIKNERAYRNKVTKENRKYDKELYDKRYKKEQDDKNFRVTQEEKVYQRRRGEKQQDFLNRQNVLSAKEDAKLKMLEKKERIRKEKESDILKFESSKFFNMSPTGYEQVDDKSKPIFEESEKQKDIVRRKASDSIKTDVGKMNKSKKLLPPELKKRLNESLYTNLDDIKSVINEYKKDKDSGYGTLRGKKSQINRREKDSSIKEYLQKAKTFYNTGEKLTIDVNNAPKNIVGYKKKNKYSPSKTEENIKFYMSTVRDTMNQVDDPDKIKSLRKKYESLGRELQSVEVDKMELLKQKNKIKLNELRIQEKAKNSLDKNKLRLNYISNIKEFKTNGYNTFNQYYRDMVKNKMLKLQDSERLGIDKKKNK